MLERAVGPGYPTGQRHFLLCRDDFVPVACRGQGGIAASGRVWHALGVLTALVLWLISMYVLYWVVRLGVQHGIEARDRARAEVDSDDALNRG